MLKSKVFNKRTRRGGVLKVVREHYLRDDIWCGTGNCTQCNFDQPVLKKDPYMPSSTCPFPHFIMLDTNAVLHQVRKFQLPFLFLILLYIIFTIVHFRIAKKGIFLYLERILQE